MTPEEMIKREVIRICLKAGLTEKSSSEAAEHALDRFKKNMYKGSPVEMIEESVRQAKKISATKKKSSRGK